MQKCTNFFNCLVNSPWISNLPNEFGRYLSTQSTEGFIFVLEFNREWFCRQNSCTRGNILGEHCNNHCMMWVSCKQPSFVQVKASLVVKQENTSPKSGTNNIISTIRYCNLFQGHYYSLYRSCICRRRNYFHWKLSGFKMQQNRAIRNRQAYLVSLILYHFSLFIKFQQGNGISTNY
jgi:hypothetical protein